MASTKIASFPSQPKLPGVEVQQCGFARCDNALSMFRNLLLETAAAEHPGRLAARIDEQPRPGLTIGGAVSTDEGCKGKERGALGAGALEDFRERLQTRASAHELVRRDRQIAHAFAGGVKYGVGDRRRNSDHSEFAHAFYAERIDDLIVFFDEHRFVFPERRH